MLQAPQQQRGSRLPLWQGLHRGARHLQPRRQAAVLDRALRQPGVGAAIVFGMSGNTRIRIRHPNWEAIGFTPVDDAESWRDRLAAEGVDVDGKPQWPLHGGAYEAKDH